MVETRIEKSKGYKDISNLGYIKIWFQRNGVWNGAMKLMTTAEAGQILGISRQRVHALIAAGRLPATRVGRSWVIADSDLAAVRVRRPGRPHNKNSAPQLLTARNRSDTIEP